jgi:hypothetical protein
VATDATREGASTDSAREGASTDSAREGASTDSAREGASTDAAREGGDAVRRGCSRRRGDYTRRLVAKGADVNVRGDDGGTRPLHLAAANGQVDALRVRWRWELTRRHLLLMERDRCTTRHSRGISRGIWRL